MDRRCECELWRCDWGAGSISAFPSRRMFPSIRDWNWLPYFSRECDCMWVGRPHPPGISNGYGLPWKRVTNIKFKIDLRAALWIRIAYWHEWPLFVFKPYFRVSVGQLEPHYLHMFAHLYGISSQFFRIRRKKMGSRIEHQGRKRKKTWIDCSQNYGNICCAQSCFRSHIQKYEWWANQIAEQLLLFIFILL